MSAIQDLPNEVLLDIFEKGCENVADAVMEWEGEVGQATSISMRHSFLMRIEILHSEARPGFKARTRKPLVQVGRQVCKLWWNIIDTSPNPTHFWTSNLGLIYRKGRFSKRIFFNFKNQLARVEQGMDLLIYFYLEAGFPSDVNELSIEEHNAFRLFIHGMFSIVAFQSRICGLTVFLGSHHAYLHLLQLLNSVHLPSLTFLALQAPQGQHKSLQVIQRLDPVQGFRPLVPQTSATRSTYTQLQYLKVPHVSWLDDMIFGSSISLLTITVDASDSPRQWFGALDSQNDLCRT
jgi:hypothetical protein